VLLLFMTLPDARPAQAAAPQPLITQPVNELSMVPLHGGLRPEAVRGYDQGRVGDALRLEHMQLLLRRSYEREQELEALIDQQHARGSAQYHHWLTPEQFGDQFGAAPSDADAIAKWLASRGFTINHIYPNRMVIDFSGTARQLRRTFHTEIHHLMVRGSRHIANMSEPQMPTALAGAVVGLVSLNDFRPHSLRRPRTQHWVGSQFTLTQQGTAFAVVPGDLATIYNLNPLFSAGISGQGQTIAVIENTNVFSADDWTTFRSTFGLSAFTSGGFAQVHPAPASGPNNCINPGVVVDNDSEAILDAEWASAAAPSATIELASCADTGTTFGGLIALENLLNGSSPPPAIVSISYGECEALNGAAANAAYLAAYQQAAAEGVSVFVSAGDAGAASCDAGDAGAAAHGVGVNAFASTPYNVAVGGTDFGDTFAGATSTYWSTTNGPNFSSALSYIPEIPWNESCASQLLASFEGFTTTYGDSGFCNSSTGKTDFLNTTAGGGGPSACAVGAPAVAGVIGGSCQGTPKPAWQAGILGNPSDGVRDLPDVSLFASSGVWGHYYIVCYSNKAGGGAPCTGSPSGWTAAGGTSFAAPILAGMQALVNQRTGERWGNPNPTYYNLAKAEYGSTGSTSCNATSGKSASSTCVFYDTTQGDITVTCTGAASCYLPSGTNGVLSTSGNAYQPAYSTAMGWDFATGIGSVNAFNLVMSWPSSVPTSAPDKPVAASGGSDKQAE
jgi:subtilase family serine protease